MNRSLFQASILRIFCCSAVLLGAMDGGAYGQSTNTGNKSQIVGKVVPGKTQKMLYNTKFGAITVETLSKTNDPFPKYSIVTPHYKVYSEIKEMDPVKDIGMILEAAYPFRKEFFGSTPKVKPILVEMYANADNYYAAGKAQKVPLAGGGYYWTGTKKAYLYWQPAGVYFTRYLMLHETGHQFDYMTGGGAFSVECISEYTGIHKWDGEEFIMGCPVPGEWILGDRPKVALEKINAKMPIKDVTTLFKGLGYEESWALFHFLINWDPAGTRTMYKDCKSGKTIEESWKKLYGTTAIDEKFTTEYINWLEKMKTYKDNDIAFTTWDALIKKHGGKSPLKQSAAPVSKESPQSKTDTKKN